MNKMPLKKSGERSDFVLEKSENHSQISVQTLNRALWLITSGGTTPGHARSITGRSTTLPIALLCFGNSVNRK